jgi:CysZ protein
MSAIQLHIFAIGQMVNAFKKGRYWKFFLPGLGISILFWILYGLLSFLAIFFSLLGNSPLIGEYLQVGVNGFFGIFEFLFDQLLVFIILTILSPVNGFLSEKIEREDSKTAVEFDWSMLVNNLLRAVFLVLLLLIMEFALIFVYWLVSLFIDSPNLDALVYFLIAAFFYGFSFYDYSFERHRKDVFSSIDFSFKNITTVLLTGSIFSILLSIPFVGIIIAPVIATMLSTWVYIKRQSSNSSI